MDLLRIKIKEIIPVMKMILIREDSLKKKHKKKETTMVSFLYTIA